MRSNKFTTLAFYFVSLTWAFSASAEVVSFLEMQEFAHQSIDNFGHVDRNTYPTNRRVGETRDVGNQGVENCKFVVESDSEGMDIHFTTYTPGLMGYLKPPKKILTLSVSVNSKINYSRVPKTPNIHHFETEHGSINCDYGDPEFSVMTLTVNNTTLRCTVYNPI